MSSIHTRSERSLVIAARLSNSRRSAAARLARRHRGQRTNTFYFHDKTPPPCDRTPNIFICPSQVLSEGSFVWENIFLPRLPFATPERFSGTLFIDDLIKITRRKLTFGIGALCIFHLIPLFMVLFQVRSARSTTFCCLLKNCFLRLRPGGFLPKQISEIILLLEETSI